MTPTTTTRTAIDVGPKRPVDQIRSAGVACALGGLVLATGGVTGQILQASTSVSDELWRYPWSERAAVLAWAAFGSAGVLLGVGILAWRRSGVAGSGRAARVGLPLAALGTLLIAAGHFACIPVRDHTIHDTSAQLVGAVLFVGSVLSAAGLLLAGRATLRAGVWQDRRRFVPISAGVATVALIGLAPTKAMPTGVALYALGFAALGLALARTRQA